MKKGLWILALTLVFAGSTCFAVPPPPAGGMRGIPPMHGGVPMGRPPMGRNWGAPPPPPRYNRGSVFVGGVLARRSCWGYSDCYYNRLGWCDDFYYPPRPPRPPVYDGGMYINVGFPIRF